MSHIVFDQEDEARSLGERQITSFADVFKKQPIYLQTKNKRNKKIIYVVITVFAAFILIYLMNNFFASRTVSQQFKEIQIKERQEEIMVFKMKNTLKDLSNRLKILQQRPKKLPPSKNTASPVQPKSVSYHSSATISEIKFLIRNKDNKGIEDVMYATDQIRQKRVQFHNQRRYFLKQKANFPSLTLVKYNMKINNQFDDEEEKNENAQYQRIRDKFGLEKISTQLPMCIIVPGYNNNANFRIQYNLNSIFTQNYTNYKAIIINDASTDGSHELFTKYFEFYNINKSKYAYVLNTERKTALQNIYIAVTNHCSQNSIAFNLDGDDEFIGKNVLKVFNAFYQQHKSGVVYSNFYWYQHASSLQFGFTSQYSNEEKSKLLYRSTGQKFSHLRTFRTDIFRQINVADFKDSNGKFYTIAYDMVMYFPLMQLSCGRVNKIQGQFHYLYNIGTGLNDYQVDRNKQMSVDQTVRGGKKYDCWKQFDERMKK